MNLSRPTAVTKMPIRYNIYPTSDSSGFVIFSYTQATISQTVSIDNLVGVNTITGVLNIVNVLNRNGPVPPLIDTFTFKIDYKDSTDNILYSTVYNNEKAPPTWTNYTLTLTRDESPNFDLIKSITVSITSKDNGGWSGQYGPAMDYCRLIVS